MTKVLDPDALRRAFTGLRNRVTALEVSRPAIPGFPAPARFNPPKRPRTREELEAVMMGNRATKEEAERDARRICGKEVTA